MADELAIKVKVPEGAAEVMIRIPYAAIWTGSDGTLLEFFYPKDVSVDFREVGGVWTPAELTGPDVLQRWVQ